MRLNKNLASLNIYRNYQKKLRSYSTSMERISSGVKINKAKDDPNKMAQSERMRLEVRSFGMASRNIQDSISMIQTTESGLDNIQKNLTRVRELLIKSKGGTNEKDKQVIMKEINQVLGSVSDLAKNTEFNGKGLIDGRTEDITVTIGHNIGEEITIKTGDMTLEGLGLESSGVLKIDINNLSESLNLVDEASKKVLSIRTKYGALENRLESTYRNLTELKDRVIGVESEIRDTNVAEEMVELSKNGLLIESANALMSQTNKFPQEILRILENVRR